MPALMMGSVLRFLGRMCMKAHQLYLFFPGTASSSASGAVVVAGNGRLLRSAKQSIYRPAPARWGKLVREVSMEAEMCECCGKNEGCLNSEWFEGDSGEGMWVCAECERGFEKDYLEENDIDQNSWTPPFPCQEGQTKRHERTRPPRAVCCRNDVRRTAEQPARCSASAFTGGLLAD